MPIHGVDVALTLVEHPNDPWLEPFAAQLEGDGRCILEHRPLARRLRRQTLSFHRLSRIGLDLTVWGARRRQPKMPQRHRMVRARRPHGPR
ncbi:MAG: hypothetical protein ACK55I_47590, partial [bacterium]